MKDRSNRVELVGKYGGDETHGLSAWCSTYKDMGLELPSNVDDRINFLFEKVSAIKKKSIDELLVMLATAGHHSPFEKSLLHFNVTSDIASHIHLLKHRVGVSINAESARYKELDGDKFFVPMDWPEEEIQEHIRLCEYLLVEYKRTLKALQIHYTGLGMSPREARKRAKESARFKLPYSTQLTCDVVFNWRSFYHFLTLRYSTHAQVEIREIAQIMLAQVLELEEFKYTVQAFNLIDEDGEMVKPFSKNFELAS